MADLNVKVGLDRSGFQTGLAAMENSAANFGRTISNIKPGNISGAFKNIANDLAEARSPAEAFQAVTQNITNLLRGTAFGAAGIAIGKVLSAPFEQLSGLVQSSAASAKQALDLIGSAGPTLSFDEAISQANALDSAIGQIQNSIQQIETNPFLRLADSFVGAKAQLEELETTMQRVKASQLSEGAYNDANLAESLVGKNSDEKARLTIKANAERERQKIKSEFEGTGLNADTAIADVNRKEAAQLADLDFRKKEENVRALAELEANFRETERNKRRREDDEEHAAAMKRAQEVLDKIDEQNKAKGALRSVEEMVAERQGPRAELDLQKRRAAEAAQLARDQGTVENVLAANQEANRLQRMLESNFRNLGFGDASFQRAQFQAEQITGMVPGVDALRDMPLSRQMQDPVQNTTVQQIANNLPSVLNRLDTLIRKAGDFSA